MSKTTAEGPMKLSEKISRFARRIALDIQKSDREELGMLTFKVEELEQAQTWIPVEAKAPEGYVAVLVLIPSEDNHITVAYLEGDGTWTRVDHADEAENPVTHWMPLPAPPSLHL